MNKSNLKYTVKRTFFVTLIAILLSGLFSFVFDKNTIELIKDAIKTGSSNDQEIVLNQSDIKTDSFIINENEWTSLESDPECVVYDINKDIDYVCINFLEGDEWQSGYNLFWTNDDVTDFTEEAFTGAYSNLGKPYVLLCGNGITKDLKILFGKQSNKTLQIESIVINPNLKERFKENFYKTILFKIHHPGRYLEKLKILLVLFLFFLLPFAIGWERFFKRRWIIGLIILLFIVANQYNGDSLSAFDSYVQHGEGSEYVTPIIGETRHVRSDEWSYSNPAYLSTNYLDNIFEKSNPIIRGTDTINEYAITWYSLYNPFNLIASLLRITIGINYAYSFKWFALIIFTALINIEFFLILTKGKKLLSVTSASMIVLSSHFLWWGFPAFVTAIPSAFVCMKGAINAKKLLTRFLWSIGISLSMAYYVLFFYPAWQVPSGYLMIPIFIWMIAENIKKIKLLNKKDWLVICVAIIFFISMIAGYLIDNMGYIHAMMNTSYPGKRFSTGGFSLQRMFNYYTAGMFPYKYLANPSAESTYISLFPLPILAALWYQHKNKWKNVLVNGLLIYTFIMLIYCAVGFPSWLAKYTVMSYSPGHRTAEVLAYSEVILFASVFANWEGRHKFGKKVAVLSSAVFVSLGLYFARLRLPKYMSLAYVVFAFVLFVIIAFMLLYKSEKHNSLAFDKTACILLIAFSLLTGMYIRPVAKGLDSIYSKPVYTEIRGIMEENPDAKWFTHGLCLSGYLLACGAPCIDSNNYYPNFELWSKLDEKNIYYEKYNRYANIFITLTDGETKMDNPQPDVLSVDLSYKDIKKTETSYILSNEPLDIDNEYVTFDHIYDQSGIYIYKIIYNK